MTMALKVNLPHNLFVGFTYYNGCKATWLLVFIVIMKKEACWLSNGSNKGPNVSLDYFILFWMAIMYL